MSEDPRRLRDLVSVGKSMEGDFHRLGIRTVAELALADPAELYDRISALDGVRHDSCVLDTYHAAVAQARDPMLPPEQRQWFWWSRKPKAEAAAHRG